MMNRKKKGRHHKSKVDKHQPAPITDGVKTVVLDLVIADIESNTITNSELTNAVLRDLQLRSHQGFMKYGTLLCLDNGRDSLMDFYQEVLDAVVYLRQFIAEYPDEAVFALPVYHMVWEVATVTRDELDRC